MKKLLAPIITIALILSLCACGAQGVSNAAVSPAVSVSIQTSSQDCFTDDSSTLLLRYSDNAPSVTVSGNESATTAINATLQALSADYSKGKGGSTGMDSMLSAAKAAYAAKPDSFAKDGLYYTMERTVDIKRGDGAVISLEYSDYSFSGGAKGSTAITGVSFDTVTGAKLTLSSLSGDPEGLMKFCKDYIGSLARSDKYKNTHFSKGYETAVSSLVADGSWVFSGEGLVFFAKSGLIADTADGTIYFTVPYEKLSDYLKSEYMPLQRKSEDGSISVSAAGKTVSDKTVGSVVLDKEGENLILTVKGSIYDAKLSSVGYSDDGSFYDTGDHMFFSDLTNGQSMAVQVSIPDTIPNLQISWTGSDGAPARRLITQSGKDGSFILLDPDPAPLTGNEVTSSLPVSADLDGDSANETLSAATRTVEGTDIPAYALSVSDGDKTAEFQTDIISDLSVWLSDIDGDKAQEIFLSGNVMSDDYVTYCLKYSAGKFVSVPFTGDSAFAPDGSDSFYGAVVTIGRGGITMNAACNILGTYGGERQFEYKDGSIQPVLGSVWTFSTNSTWLKVTSSLPVTDDDGSASTLAPGASIRLASSDLSSWVSYVTEDGNLGRIALTKSDDYWGWYINGKAETDYFDFLPYAG